MTIRLLFVIKSLRRGNDINLDHCHYGVVDCDIMSSPEQQLLAAVNKNKFEAVRAILRKYPDVDVDQLNCIHWAVTFGRLEMVKLLIEAGAKLDSYGMAGKETPLKIAVSHNHVAIAEILLESGADPNLGSERSGIAPIMSASTDIVALLLRYNVNVNVADQKGGSPLLKAVEMNRPELVKILLDAGAVVDHTDNDGYTALILAVENSLDSIVKVLLQYGADRSICAPSGRSVLQMATQPSTRKLLEAHYRRVAPNNGITEAVPVAYDEMGANKSVKLAASAPPMPTDDVTGQPNNRPHRKKSWLHSLFHTTKGGVASPALAHESAPVDTQRDQDRNSTAKMSVNGADATITSTAGATIISGECTHSNNNSSDGAATSTAVSKMSAGEAPYRPLHRAQRSPPVPAAAQLLVPLATVSASGVKACSFASADATSVDSGRPAQATVLSTSQPLTVSDGSSNVGQLAQRLAGLEKLLEQQARRVEALEGLVESQGAEISQLRARLGSPT